MFAAYSSGFWIGLSLIIAIGAQNAFVLRQGLLGQHVLPVVLFCVLSDAVLIVAGVAGFDLLVARYPQLVDWARLGGVVFLCAYALFSFYRAWRAHGSLEPAKQAATGLATALWTCALLTWLNPHVYLDTVVLLGAISTQFGAQNTVFAAGAVSASLVLFFSLGFGARLLRPWFAKPGTWVVLEVLVGLVMLWVAARLLMMTS